MKNLIVWVEDRPDTVLTQKGFLERRGFEVKFVSTPNRLADRLKKEKDRTALIILDIMLFGVQSLKSLGKPDISTEGGYEAGWVLAKVFLRESYKDIPILFLSARPFNSECQEKLQEIDDLGEGWVDCIEKGSVDGKDWTRKFEEMIENKLTGKNS